MARKFREENENIAGTPSVRQYKKSKTRRKKRFSLSKSKIPVLLLVLLMAYSAISLCFRFDNLYAMRQNIQEMEQQVNRLEKRNAMLKEELEKIQSKSYVEKVAREELGLIKAGETRVVPVQDLPREEEHDEE